MENLCLENYGVSNLEIREMETTNGGIAPLVVALVIICFFAGTQKAH